MAESKPPILNVTRDSDTAVVALAGDIDVRQAEEVKASLLDVCRSTPRRLVVNLAEVSYIDSSGIGALVEVFRAVLGYRGQMVLCCLNQQVYKVFEITRLTSIFKIYATQEEAIQQPLASRT